MQHQSLAAGRWNKFPIAMQLANVGSEVGRAIKWKGKNPRDSMAAFERALELLDMTIADAKNKKRLKELLRVREMLGDYFFGGNEYSSSDELWEKYFNNFNYYVQNTRNYGAGD